MCITMRHHALGAVCGVVTAAVLTPVLCALASGALFGRNLIVNGGAEAWAHPRAATYGEPLGWTTTGTFTVEAYGAPGGYPKDTSPGSPQRGSAFFSGGHAPLSTASQTISLAAAAGPIDAGRVRFALSGWLGGYGGQSDNMRVAVRFMRESGETLATASLPPVLARDRNGVTGMLRRTAQGRVPRDTRSAYVLVTSARADGFANDGYADDLSLVLSDRG
jgi:hypothetical protein